MNRFAAPHVFLLGAILLVLSVPAQSLAVPIHGIVFEDSSADGVQNGNEKGLAKVAVSNGRDIVLSNAEGRFQIETGTSDFIFLIKPSGWTSPLSAFMQPAFYRKVESNSAPASPLTFPLIRQVEPSHFRVLVTADPQVSSEKEVGYYEKSLTARFSPKDGFAFGVVLGDIVNDQFQLFAKINSANAKIGIPWYPLNGNHDVDFSAPPEKKLEPYQKVNGPASYAFNYSGVLFVALDDIRPLEKGYIGGLTVDQFKFLDQLLQQTPEEARVVIMLHIPLFQNGDFGAETFRRGDRDLLFTLLGKRKNVLVLSGHTHSQCHVFHKKEDGWTGDSPLHEYNVAAACGSFWNGPPNAAGIPVATMWDGTPPGCAILSFQGSKSYQIQYVPWQHPAEFQIGLSTPATTIAGQAWVSFYANVFNGHDGWKVEARVDQGPWKAMRRVEGWDPAYAKAFLDQNQASPPVPWGRLPDPKNCRHLWRDHMPKTLAPGQHRLEVRAIDPDGSSFTASQPFETVEK